MVLVAQGSEADAALLVRPNRAIRLLVGAVFVAGGIAAVLVALSLHLGRFADDASSLVQAMEAAMNIVVLVGIGVVALTRMEMHWKRRRALTSLHQLRSLAHVIDMHQLAKDIGGQDIDLAPEPDAKPPLEPAELERYLDYCTELLSLVGKLSALYAESCHDQGITEAVSDIEVLTTNLSRTIWQKIALIENTRG